MPKEQAVDSGVSSWQRMASGIFGELLAPHHITRQVYPVLPGFPAACTFTSPTLLSASLSDCMSAWALPQGLAAFPFPADCQSFRLDGHIQFLLQIFNAVIE